MNGKIRTAEISAAYPQTQKPGIRAVQKPLAAHEFTVVLFGIAAE
jgi:hypothetical protein